jgi:hypothetical protein
MVFASTLLKSVFLDILALMENQNMLEQCQFDTLLPHAESIS